MERGTRRLLHDLDVVGRVQEDRLSARERLQLEVGPTMARRLPADGNRSSSAGPARRGRRVA
jgi:hypothetical protein